MKQDFTVWGFKFNKKTSLYVGIFAIVFLSIFLLLDFVFGVDISWYGVIIGCGFLVAIMFYTKLSEYRGLPDDFAYDLIWWVFPLSIVGARTYYVLCSLEEFSSFYEMIAIWNGGMAIYGGIIGGLIGVIICCLIKKKNIVSAIDVICPPLILAQAIGRWGNFVNQEVYGFEVTNKSLQWFPFAVHITENGLDQWHLATFFYESFLNLIGFFILVTILRKCKLKGIVASSYLTFYGIVRYFLEGLRIDGYILKIPGTNFAVSQAVSIACVLVGVIWLTIILCINLKKKKNLKETTDTGLDTEKQSENLTDSKELNKESKEISKDGENLIKETKSKGKSENKDKLKQDDKNSKNKNNNSNKELK